MGLPPSVKTLLPSLQIKDDRTATIAIADIKRHLPSLRIRSEVRDLSDAITLSMSLEDLRKVLRIALAGVEVDEKWYVTQVPGLADALKNGAYESAAEHYRIHGYLENRPAARPTVDESYYLKTYPDIEQAIKSGKLKSSYDHYLTVGYAEGRKASPPRRSKRTVIS
jgi:hypothetical protein